MAYQNVGGTPRFYIDHIQYLKSIGFDFQKWYDDYGFDYSKPVVSFFYKKPAIRTKIGKKDKAY